MEFNTSNFPRLPEFLFCDIVHDFLEGHSISDDFELDFTLIANIFNNHFANVITPELIAIINKKKIVKTARTFLSNAHNYLYNVCKKEGKFLMDVRFNCTDKPTIRVLGQEFEEIKS